MFNGQMTIDSREPVGHLPAYSAWNKQVGAQCFFRGGQKSEVFSLDPRWKTFDAFRDWWDRQEIGPGTAVSTVLAPAGFWRVYGPDTCRMLPRRLHSFMLNFYRGLSFADLEEKNRRLYHPQSTVVGELEEEIQDNAGMFLRDWLRQHTLDPKIQRAMERKIMELEGYQVSTMPFMD